MRALLLGLACISVVLPACGGDETGLSAETPLTSAQDPKVAKMRGLFVDAQRASLAAVGTRSPTGMITGWKNCTERSAKRNDTSVSTVDYVFSGSGEDVVNLGGGFGKTFITDASQGGEARDVVGYPEATPNSTTVTLDVVRFGREGDLLIERILKPAGSAAYKAFEEMMGTEYERSAYADPRAFAVAYVRCPVADRGRWGGGNESVLYFDDCRDPDFTAEHWKDSGGQHSSACSRYGYMEFPAGDGEINTEVGFDQDFSVATRRVFIAVTMADRKVRIGWGSTPTQVVPLPQGATTLRIQQKRGDVTVFSGMQQLGTPMREDGELYPRRIVLSPMAGRFTSIKIW
jgi:hypothetical protein